MESTFLHSSTTVGDQSFNKGSSQRGKTWRVVKKVMVSLQAWGMKDGFTITCVLIKMY